MILAGCDASKRAIFISVVVVAAVGTAGIGLLRRRRVLPTYTYLPSVKTFFIFVCRVVVHNKKINCSMFSVGSVRALSSQCTIKVSLLSVW